MIRESGIRMLFGALLLMLLATAAGFLDGLLSSASPRPRPAEDTISTRPAPTTHGAGVALRALDAHGHWGSYTPPAAARDTAATEPVPPVQGAGELARAWQLVGIEWRGRNAQALLLPTVTDASAAEVLRLGPGDTLADGIRVSAIERDSVRFTTPGGDATLHLYGAEP